MKTLTIRLLSLVLVLAGGTVLSAQSSNPQRNDTSYHDSLNDVSSRKFALDLIDRDARIQLERQEAAQRTAQTVSPLAASNFDINHDGKLDAKEMVAWEKAVRAAAGRSPAAIKRYDANHDGKLDDAEWAVLWTALTTTPEPTKS